MHISRNDSPIGHCTRDELWNGYKLVTRTHCVKLNRNRNERDDNRIESRTERNKIIEINRDIYETRISQSPRRHARRETKKFLRVKPKSTIVFIIFFSLSLSFRGIRSFLLRQFCVRWIAISIWFHIVYKCIYISLFSTKRIMNISVRDSILFVALLIFLQFFLAGILCFFSSCAR